MPKIKFDLSLLSASPETDSLIKSVLKFIARGGVIITERDGELITHAEPDYGFVDKRPEFPTLPFSPEHSAYLIHNAPIVWEKLHLDLADLDHANRHSRRTKPDLVQMIEYHRTIGGLKFRSDWYVLRTWKRRGYPPPHPRTDYTL